ncbi:serine/threonine protein kinase [Aspergillus sclerotioniger CBS 115572]|uniref:Serine/threonine protein kinase n=1 Tax=Aspergillus sclerotioniger CBS 115572 TaxID=1450535 RepID=A0A317UW87_9EURO|nr:serine/threonine protein kinase [Aspergillus sclerotioniger CBS 115572]PWY64777.1 serine/threonine protein kinase [Aspergillus sclerotioniger CBS 115572]
MSGRPGITEKRLSAHRFQQLPDMTPDMANPNDVTIDIPLNPVPSRNQTGARKTSSNIDGSPNPYQPPGNDKGTGEKDGLVAPNPGMRRRIDESTGRSLEDPEDGTVTRMGLIYQAILNYSVITRYFIYVAPLALLFAIPIIVGATVAQDATIGGVTLPWFWFWIEIVWVSLWLCKLAAMILPYIFQALCGFVSSGTRKYALILRKLEMPIATVFWCVVCLVTFLPVMTQNPHQKAKGDTSTKSWEKSIKNILFALFVCSLIFLAEKTMVHLISISYHRKQFDARIKESKRNVYLVGLLFDASRHMFPMYCKEFREEDAAISDSLLRTAASKTKRTGSSSAPLRMIRAAGQNVHHFGNKVTAAFGDVAHELTGKQVFNPTSTRSVVTQAMEHRRTAEALARRIWMSFVIEGREALYFDDICEVLGAGMEAEAEECFAMLDRDGNGDISLEEMILAVGEVRRMRKSLNNSLHDVDQAIHVLDNLLLTVAGVIAVLVFVSFVTTGFGTVIAAGATSLLSLSFVFSTTAQEVLGSCIFLFVKHPFDVGDRVEISDKPYFVERISLLFTVFRNVNDHRMTQVPNVVLNTLWIDNFTRANAMHERLTISVSFATTFTNIQQLQEEMETFVRDKDNCRDFQPEVTIDVVGLGDMDKMELSVLICHKSNWSNEAVRAARRSKFMCALITAVRKVPIRAPGASADDDDKDEPKDDDKTDTGLEDQTLPVRQVSIASEGVRRANTTAGGLTVEHATRSQDGSRDGHDAEQYQTPVGSPGQERQLNVTYGLMTREPSTGRRKEGRTSYVSPEGDVPVLSQPVPPRHRVSLPRVPSAGSVEPMSGTSSSQPPEYYNYPGQYYDAEDPYDPNQPFELPSTLEPTEPREYPSPTRTTPHSESEPGRFAPRR